MTQRIFAWVIAFAFLFGVSQTAYAFETETRTIEKEKFFAEKLNGRFAMLGIIAGLGDYLTTGQIIPGFV